MVGVVHWLAVAVRCFAGLALGAAAIVMAMATEAGDGSGRDCGVAPVAAFGHESGACRVAGTEQSLAASVIGSVAITVLAGPPVVRWLWADGAPRWPRGTGERPAFDGRARRELRRYRTRAWVLVAVGLAVLVSVGLVVDRAYDRRRDLDRGTRKAGVVIDTRSWRHGDSVVVEFDSRERRERIYVEDSSAYDKGQRVTVLIDRKDHDHIALVGEDNFAPWAQSLTATAAGVGLVILGIGIPSLLRAARQRVILERYPWRRLDIAYVEVPTHNSVRSLLLLWDGRHPHGVVLSLASLTKWRLPSASLRSARAADVAGPIPGYVVLRLPGTDQLLSARPPYRDRDEQRWRDHLREAAVSRRPPRADRMLDRLRRRRAGDLV